MISVKEWLRYNKMDIDNVTHVMCVHTGYKPHFMFGEFYAIKGNGVKSHGYTITKMDKYYLNKLFIPLQGTPSNLTIRDRLLIKVRSNIMK